jgi:hypothetical protein
MKRRPRTPEPNEVLTTSEVARWLQVSERTVERHYPAFLPGRYLVAHVLEVMAREAKAA